MNNNFNELTDNQLEDVNGGISNSKNEKPIINATCISCYSCVNDCPNDAIYEDVGKFSIDPNRCIACGNCVANCPVGAATFDY